MKVLVTVYSNPEGYPPTLNAINCIAQDCEKVFVLSRNFVRPSWEYPKNAIIVTSGKECITIKESQEKSFLWKLKSLYDFAMKMLQMIKEHKPEIILLYDPYPLLALQFIEKLLPYKPICWYHNHDIVLPTTKFNLTTWAVSAEKNLFPKLDFFSLPSDERKGSFPMEKLGGNYCFIPNLPTLSLYQPFYKAKSILQTCKFIYQGTIAKGHGLENIITHILPHQLANKSFELVLKGLITEEYKQELIQLAQKVGVSKQVFFHGFTDYKEVPLLASQCHIGLAIHTGTDIMNKTLGTSSNKIYEYAAVGLPVILYDNQHFRQHLGKHKWAFFTDLSEQSLNSCIEQIVENYEELSAQAHKDFVEKLNFESYFLPVWQQVKVKIPKLNNN